LGKMRWRAARDRNTDLDGLGGQTLHDRRTIAISDLYDKSNLSKLRDSNVVSSPTREPAFSAPGRTARPVPARLHKQRSRPEDKCKIH
jgi:hypothetical protein